MAKNKGRAIRVTWTADEGGQSQHVEVDAFPIVANMKMVDRCLRKAELTEFQQLLDSSNAEWLDRGFVTEAISNATIYFAEHPESLPFSDILDEYFQALLQALSTIPSDHKLKLTIA